MKLLCREGAIQSPVNCVDASFIIIVEQTNEYKLVGLGKTSHEFVSLNSKAEYTNGLIDDDHTTNVATHKGS